MRLTRPTLASPIPVTCDSKDLPGNLLNNALQQDPLSVEGTETLCLGQFLLLPQLPVNIYLGETFSSYVNVYSETEQIVHNISVNVSIMINHIRVLNKFFLQIDLQTSSQRLSLCNNLSTPQLIPEETISCVIHHEVKEVGTHMYVKTLVKDLSYVI